MSEDVREFVDPNTIENKIVHQLGIFPRLSATMLQMGLGPQTKAAEWKPVLFQMIRRGIIAESMETYITPASRHNVYTIFTLTEEGKMKFEELQGILHGAATPA